MITPDPSQRDEASHEDDMVSQGMNGEEEEEDQLVEENPWPPQDRVADHSEGFATHTQQAVLSQPLRAQTSNFGKYLKPNLPKSRPVPLKRSRSSSVNFAAEDFGYTGEERRAKLRRLTTPMRDPSPTTFENSAIGQLEGSQEPDEAASQSDDSESERTHVPNPQEAGLPSPKAVFQCVGFDQCSAVFPDLVGLNVHVEYTHNPTETRFTCHCGMVLPNFIALFQHAQLVHPDEPEKNGALLVEVARPKASAAPFPSSSSRDGTLPSRMTPSDTHSSPLHHDHTPSRSRSARSSRTATPLSIQHHSPPRYISASGELSQSIPPDHGSLPNAAAESSPVQSHPITPTRHPHNSSAPTSAPSRSKLSHIGASPRSSIFTPISKFSSSRSKVSQSVPRPSTASSSGMSLKPKTSGWKPRTSTADQSYISAMELEEEDEDAEENTQLSVTKGVIPGNVGFALNRTILGDIDFSPSGDVVTPRRATTVDRAFPPSTSGRTNTSGRSATQPPTSSKSRKSVTFTASTEALALSKDIVSKASTPRIVPKRSSKLSPPQRDDWYATPPPSLTPVPSRARASQAANDPPFTRPLFLAPTPEPLQDNSVEISHSHIADGQHEGPSSSKSSVPPRDLADMEDTPSSVYSMNSKIDTTEHETATSAEPRASLSKSLKKRKPKRRETFAGFSTSTRHTKGEVPRVNLAKFIADRRRGETPFIPRIIRWPSPEAETSPARKPHLSLAAQRIRRQSLPTFPLSRSSLSSVQSQRRTLPSTSRRRSRFSLSNLPQPKGMSSPSAVPTSKRRMSAVDQERALAVGLDVLLQGMAQHRGLSKERVERVWRAVGDLEKADIILGQLSEGLEEALKELIVDRAVATGDDDEVDIDHVAGEAERWVYGSNSGSEATPSDSEIGAAEEIGVSQSRRAHRTPTTRTFSRRSSGHKRTITAQKSRTSTSSSHSTRYRLQPPPTPTQKYRDDSEETNVSPIKESGGVPLSSV